MQNKPKAAVHPELLLKGPWWKKKKNTGSFRYL
jgi:hypothetical protein